MRKKIRFYKALLSELIETIVSICLYIEADSVINRTYNKYGFSMRSHARSLKDFSETLRKEVYKNPGEKERKKHEQY